MSIEKLIEENTAALQRLTDALAAFDKNVARAETLAENTVAKDAPVKKPTSGKPSSGTAKEPPASSAASDTGAAIAKPEAFEDFATLAEAGTKLVQSGKRDALVAILAEYKVPKLSALREESWLPVYERILEAQEAAE